MVFQKGSIVNFDPGGDFLLEEVVWKEDRKRPRRETEKLGVDVPSIRYSIKII